MASRTRKVKARRRKVKPASKKGAKPSATYLSFSSKAVRRGRTTKDGVFVKGYQRVENFVNIFEEQVVLIARRTLKKSAQGFARYVKDILRKQKYNWRPLSEKYLEYKKRYSVVRGTKKRKGKYIGIYRNPAADKLKNLGADVKRLDLRILIATKEYLNSIKPRPVQQKGDVLYYRIGPPRGIHKPSGMSYKRLARLHEFGSRKGHLTPRPLWRPAWSAYLRSGAVDVLKEVKEEAIEATRKKASRLKNTKVKRKKIPPRKGVE